MSTANGGRVCTTFNRFGMLRDNFWQPGSRVKRVGRWNTWLRWVRTSDCGGRSGRLSRCRRHWTAHV